MNANEIPTSLRPLPPNSPGTYRATAWQALKRGTDLVIGSTAAFVALPLCVLIAIAIRIHDGGPALYWSSRAGRNGRLFRMPKFRTMRVNAPEVATDRLAAPELWLTSIGRLLRRTSLDELPQLWSVLKGEMSLVGPRPALFNQHALISARSASGIDAVRPGITGWAQVNGRDDLTDEQKLHFDRDYVRRASLAFDCQIIAMTALRVLRSEGVRH
jgi:O-antigen biosynthesis protein WbqP